MTDSIRRKPHEFPLWSSTPEEPGRVLSRKDIEEMRRSMETLDYKWHELTVGQLLSLCVCDDLEEPNGNAP